MYVTCILHTCYTIYSIRATCMQYTVCYRCAACMLPSVLHGMLHTAMVLHGHGACVLHSTSHTCSMDAACISHWHTMSMGLVLSCCLAIPIGHHEHGSRVKLYGRYSHGTMSMGLVLSCCHSSIGVKGLRSFILENRASAICRMYASVLQTY